MPVAPHITPDWWDPIDAASAVKGAAAGIKGNPVGMNRYAYAGNDPINKSDRNGHFFGWDDAIASFSGAVVGVGLQAASDVWHGEVSSFGTYARAAGAGAISAEVGYHATLAGGPMAGGAAAGAAYSAADDLLRGERLTPPKWPHLPDGAWQEELSAARSEVWSERLSRLRSQTAQLTRCPGGYRHC